ncbi:MAG: transketolase [Deltaproteobacteria bacterium]|jgi:transketolase|nr:transketolase [Deltaproteobacteria bacterium]
MSTSVYNRKDRASVDTLRLLAVDMVEAARSGHPGLPLGASPLVYVLWTRFLKHDPGCPKWPNRDRFVLSPGHGSALLYALLHLVGYDISMDELKRFRQFGSITSGHPEYGLTPGVEVSTGPLGHGMAMGVGLAMAERYMGARFNRPDATLFDHYTYGLVSDGDLMEGVTSEAASLAGTQCLGKLIYLYDDNHMTIEGSTDLAFSEDVRARFLAYSWQVIVVSDGNDLASIHLAIENARANTEKPSLIMCRTKLGAGSPRENTSRAHGEPLGPEALAKTREFYGYGDKPPFFIDDRVLRNFRDRTKVHETARLEWYEHFSGYATSYPAEYKELTRRLEGRLPEITLTADFPKDKKIATRTASGLMLNTIARQMPELLGGSADLGPSNKTELLDFGSFLPFNPAGRNIHFGVREQAMGAIVNGLTVYQGIRSFGSTFFVFSDFIRPSVRLACLMNLKSIFIFTHDSIGVGEDGPTHQPVEQLASFRVMPGLTVIRPADAYETAVLWPIILEIDGPTALVLSRQDLPVLHPDDYPAVLTGPVKGGYVISDCPGEPEAIILATGSEVCLALEVQKRLSGQRKIRVVSLPSWEIFEAQDKSYRDEVLPPNVGRRLALEMGSSFGWERYTGPQGKMISVDIFGHSAPAEELIAEFGFTPENAEAKVLELFD